MQEPYKSGERDELNRPSDEAIANTVGVYDRKESSIFASPVFLIAIALVILAVALVFLFLL